MAKPERCDNCQENPPAYVLSDLSDGETGFMCIPCLVGTVGQIGEAFMAIMSQAALDESTPDPTPGAAQMSESMQANEDRAGEMFEQLSIHDPVPGSGPVEEAHQPAEQSGRAGGRKSKPSEGAPAASDGE